ncbi:MAG: FAD-binding protein [Coriobacteriales bacterium]|nr:FAD-binding protein [Coriobacteriales bacterium]
MKDAISRRNLIKGAAAATAAAGLASVAKADEAPDIEWGLEADIVVLGTGGAGLTTAITAARAGADVLVLEKACEEDQGGNTRVSGNMWCIPTDLEEGLKYYLKASERTSDNEYLTALATAAHTINEDFIGDLEGANIIEFPMFSPEYDSLPGGDAIQSYMMGFGGNKLWICQRETAAQYDNIRFMYETPGIRLITDTKGMILGVVALVDGVETNVKAKKAVVLATGGYEYNPLMVENSYPGWPVYSRGTPYNTGDGIKMAQKVGAQLWHMNASDSGPAAMLCPGIDFGHGAYDSDRVPANFSYTSASARSAGFIYVDKHGKRFMPENRPDHHGYGRREYIFFYDGVKCEWPRLPLWCIFDEQQAQAGPCASAPATEDTTDGFTWFYAHSHYVWSADNSAEVEKGWIVKADTIEELAAKMNEMPDGEGKMDAETLQATIENYNAMCEAGEDTEFGRPADSMRPLVGPFYAVPVYPNQYNTQGGPKRNTKAQTLDAFDEPIPRLYNVGECGAGYGWVYNGGWNNCESMISGIWAATDAMTLEDWDA